AGRNGGAEIAGHVLSRRGGDGTMKLYFWPKSRAFRILWMLEEIGATCDLVPVNLRAGAQGTPQYRAINPMMKVPTLVDGKAVVSESGAILLYLAEKYPAAKLAPGPGEAQRGRFLQLLFFVGNCLEPAMAARFAGATPHPFSFGWGDLDRVVQYLEGVLKPGPYVLGQHFSAADILLGSTLQIALQAKLIA